MTHKGFLKIKKWVVLLWGNCQWKCPPIFKITKYNMSFFSSKIISSDLYFIEMIHICPKLVYFCLYLGHNSWNSYTLYSKLNFFFWSNVPPPSPSFLLLQYNYVVDIHLSHKYLAGTRGGNIHSETKMWVCICKI